MGDRLLRGFVELATELQKPLYLGIEMHSRGASKGSRARIAKRNFGTVESNRASSVERTPSGAPLHFEDVKANAGRKISAHGSAPRPAHRLQDRPDRKTWKEAL
jgi:hypothetical protein